MDLSEEEGAHRTAVGVVALGLAPRAHEHLLHDLFGEHPIAEHPAGEGERGRPVALVELGQRALVATDDGRAERGIVGVAEITLRQASIGHGSCSAPTTLSDGIRSVRRFGCGRGIVAHPPTFARVTPGGRSA